MGSIQNLNFKSFSPNSKLYRYISLECLLNIYETGNNTLRLPSVWEDPFENFYLRSPIQFSDGEQRNLEWAGTHIFAQCWTTERRSDAMWRLYCHPKILGSATGVRIRTTIGKLGRSLADALSPAERSMAFIGQVRYVADRAISRETSTFYQGSVTPEKIAQALLMKRRAFRHEKEVRIIVRSIEPTDGGSYAYRFRPEETIEQIMIDPWAKDDQIRQAKERLRAVGVRREVLRSLLYSAPKPTTLPFGMKHAT